MNKERIVLKDLTIKDVIKKYKNDKFSNIFTIKFNPNYMKSSTRYILVIAQMDANNSMENLNKTNNRKNRSCFNQKLLCYWTK